MFTITLVVTYLLSVVRAVAAKRAFASSVSGLGSTPQEVVLAGWDRSDLRSLDLPLQDLASQLSSIADQHNAFPVLHHFHTAQRRQAPTVAVATLDDALTVIDGAVAADGPSRAVVTELRSSIDDYLGTLQAPFVVDRPVPDAPDIDALGAAGVPVVDADRSRAHIDRRTGRRRRLREVVEGDAWPWRPEEER